jgi:geranylgeranylglycerol-phosphate geranylgeranyltransferase
MFAYLEMMRLGNCLMSIIAVLIGGLLVAGPNPAVFLNPFSVVYMAAFVVFLITGAGNAINDFVDIESDKINRPDRPIPSGRASAKGTFAFTILLFLAGIAISGFINWVAFIIAIVNSCVLILYSYSLQNKIFIGNISIGYLVGSTFLFGGAALGNLKLPFLLMLLAMFSTIAREIVKDLEDLEGDRKSFLKRIEQGVKKFAERFGVGESGDMPVEMKKSRIFAFLSLLLSVAVSPLPYVMGIFSENYLVFLMPCIAVFVYCLVKMAGASTKGDFAHISRSIKVGMNFGLLAFVMGVLL